MPMAEPPAVTQPPMLQAYPYGHVLPTYIQASHHDLYTQITPQLYSMYTTSTEYEGAVMSVNGYPHFFATKHKTENVYYLFLYAFMNAQYAPISEQQYIKLPYYYYEAGYQHLCLMSQQFNSIDYDDTANDNLFNLPEVNVVTQRFYANNEFTDVRHRFVWTYKKLTESELNELLNQATNITRENNWVFFDLATPITGFDATDTNISFDYKIFQVERLVTPINNNQLITLWQQYGDDKAFAMILPQDTDIAFAWVDTDTANRSVHTFQWDHNNRTLTIDGTTYTELSASIGHTNYIPYQGGSGLMALDNVTINPDEFEYPLVTPIYIKVNDTQLSSKVHPEYVQNDYQTKLNDLQNVVIFSGDIQSVISAIDWSYMPFHWIAEYYAQFNNIQYHKMRSTNFYNMYIGTAYQASMVYAWFSDRLYSGHPVYGLSEVIATVTTNNQSVPIRAYNEGSISNFGYRYSPTNYWNNAKNYPLIMDISLHGIVPQNYAEYVRVFANEVNPPMFLDIGTTAPKDEVLDIDNLEFPPPSTGTS